MKDTVPRKVLAYSLVAVAPLFVVVLFSLGGAAARFVALAAGVVGIALVWMFSSALSREINQLAMFADRLQDLGTPLPQLKARDDELGDLVRSLSRMAPEIDALVKRLSTELARREAILAAMTEGVLAVDSRLLVTFCNKAFAEAVGDHGIAEGVPLIRIVRHPVLLQLLKRVIDTGEALRERLQFTTTETRSFEVYAAPFVSESFRGAIAILHDVTPAERLERVKRDFIANVSHEIRTPIATIRGYAETLLEGALDDTQNRRKFVETIQATAVRLNNIAADLLTLSEVESGWPDTRPTPVSVSEVVQGAVRAVEPAANLLTVTLKVGPIPELRLLAHGIRLEQALVNLLDNAVKFNKPNGEVRVEVRSAAENRVEIEISDTGIGVPSEDLSRIFERFYRVDKARSRHVGGTGLGLSIVKHVVEQMNGAVTVESELGNGTRFVVTLPEYQQRRLTSAGSIVDK
jgi:two-component system phosphate regulon sensor histidine kinase PhoR